MLPEAKLYTVPEGALPPRELTEEWPIDLRGKSEDEAAALGAGITVHPPGSDGLAMEIGGVVAVDPERGYGVELMSARYLSKLGWDVPGFEQQRHAPNAVRCSIEAPVYATVDCSKVEPGHFWPDDNDLTRGIPYAIARVQVRRDGQVITSP